MILTKTEKAWVKKLNKVLAEVPSDRLSFYAGGDNSVLIFDATHSDEIDEGLRDPILVAQENDWVAIETIDFPSPVSAVCF